MLTNEQRAAALAAAEAETPGQRSSGFRVPPVPRTTQSWGVTYHRDDVADAYADAAYEMGRTVGEREADEDDQCAVFAQIQAEARATAAEGRAERAEAALAAVAEIALNADIGDVGQCLYGIAHDALQACRGCFPRVTP